VELILDVRDLHIEFTLYEGIARVVCGLSFEVAAGEKVVLVGESGSGKSITARAVMRLLPPGARITAGSIRFAGVDLLALDELEMHRTVRGRGIAMVFQDPVNALNPLFSVGEQLADVICWQGERAVNWLHYALGRLRRSEAERVRRRSLELLDRVRIPVPEQTLRSYPSQLSGGMCQRVMIALALANRPRLLIADEPTTALDVSIQAQILELFEETVRELGTGLLYITHDLGVARAIGDRILVMYAGRIVEAARADALFQAPLHPYTRGLLGSIPRITGEVGEGIDGSPPDYLNPPPGCRFAPRCPEARSVCSRQVPSEVDAGEGHRVACLLYAETGRAT